MPHSSGQTMAAWSPAATPSRVWPSMMRADLAAIEMSASRPATRPAPTAGPCMAETIGLREAIRLRTSRVALLKSCENCWLGSKAPATGMSSSAPPAQKARPSPVMIVTRVSGSASMAAQTASSCRCMVGVTALALPGLLRVRRSTCGAGRSNFRRSKAA
jgi:hypothetical protein